jgi:hypothetical protein
MKTIDYAEANLPLADYAWRLKKAPVIITKEGKPLADLISLINADMETISLSNNPKFVALIERSHARQKKMVLTSFLVASFKSSSIPFFNNRSRSGADPPKPPRCRGSGWTPAGSRRPGLTAGREPPLHKR